MTLPDSLECSQHWDWNLMRSIPVGKSNTLEAGQEEYMLIQPWQDWTRLLISLCSGKNSALRTVQVKGDYIQQLSGDNSRLCSTKRKSENHYFKNYLQHPISSPNLGKFGTGSLEYRGCWVRKPALLLSLNVPQGNGFRYLFRTTVSVIVDWAGPLFIFICLREWRFAGIVFQEVGRKILQNKQQHFKGCFLNLCPQRPLSSSSLWGKFAWHCLTCFDVNSSWVSFLSWSVCEPGELMSFCTLTIKPKLL